MKNIFENAYFDKKYKTRDGSKAIFICERTNGAVWDLNRPYACVVEGYGEIWNYFPNGRLYIGEKFETENDIISEWEEEIDEEQLDDLAYDYNEERRPNYWWEDDCTVCVCEASEVRKAFESGYKAAKKGE